MSKLLELELLLQRNYKDTTIELPYSHLNVHKWVYFVQLKSKVQLVIRLVPEDYYVSNERHQFKELGEAIAFLAGFNNVDMQSLIYELIKDNTAPVSDSKEAEVEIAPEDEIGNEVYRRSMEILNGRPVLTQLKDLIGKKLFIIEDGAPKVIKIASFTAEGEDGEYEIDSMQSSGFEIFNSKAELLEHIGKSLDM